ncbi:S1C family serine protease [Mariniblastus fucicola]|uniref:Periplasmic pH-dependent serine endoprotease DegQ n=1 Tax=Mariniblastus fucicola TaxID=980251 RepID=A0A5B9PB47_9BACT|nr:trypsin-like peptidase domain-containing protein [Mariniblastus fucicola]QEG23514.1 Periplasmic pH-dependent serine endoprotease DegQ precursor [Mariniblastus fucicola]
MTPADLVRVLLCGAAIVFSTANAIAQEIDPTPSVDDSASESTDPKPADSAKEIAEGTPASPDPNPDENSRDDIGKSKVESPDEETVQDLSAKNEDQANSNANAKTESDVEHAKKLAELKKLRRIDSMLENVIPRVTPCIVSIGDTATGVIVKPSGIVITASHVTRKANRVLIIRLQDGRTVKGITLGSNAANDTSAIQLIGNGPWPYLKTVSPDYTAQAGQWCVAFGYPLSWPRDKPASARIGRVTGQYRGKIVTDCPIMGGDSGGALVDLNGNLLGINSSVRLDVTQNLHVPIARYREDWTYMMTRQDVDVVTAMAARKKSLANGATTAKKPYLGIYGESSHNGVRIRDVRRDSPAEKAGLLPEDVISHIDETTIGSFAELLKYLSTRQGGDKITVGVNRFGVNLQHIVTLDQR